MTTKLTDEQKPHVFDPIHNGADECECGLTENADIHESDNAYEDRMRLRIVNAPDRVWLQTGCDSEAGEIDWKDLSHPDVSWCDERIDNTDIEYVRADLSPVVDVDAEELVDEVQHRMDQVVEAAVEWHQAGQEGGEWFEAAEKLGAAINSLLELRAATPNVQPSDPAEKDDQ